MRLHHFALSFAVIAYMIIAVTDLSIAEKSYIISEQRNLDAAFDRAVDAAADTLTGVPGGQSAVGREEAEDAFFCSLSASFGILDAPLVRQKLELYVPVIVVTDTDGFYVCYSDYIEDGSGQRVISRCWSDKLCYAYDDGILIYRFTGDSTVTVFDSAEILSSLGMGRVFKLDVSHIAEFEGYGLLLSMHPESIILSGEAFSLRRDETICSTLKKYLEYYCSRHNKIAQHIGISYEFSFPETDADVFMRAAANVGFLALFQGYPYFGSAGVYNRFSVANAQIREKTAFYLDPSSNLYHRYGCDSIFSSTEVYYSEKECALRGAYACQVCR